MSDSGWKSPFRTLETAVVTVDRPRKLPLDPVGSQLSEDTPEMWESVPCPHTPHTVSDKKSNKTTVGKFSKFNICGRFTLLSLPAFASLCAPDR